MRRALLITIIAAMATACGDGALDPLPLEVTVAASKTVTAPRDTISFLVTAQGGNLIGLQMDYADASSDLYGTSGARTANVTFRHAFATAGTYQVTVTVTDGLAGQKNATVQIRIN